MSATIEDLTELAELLYRADGYEDRRAAWEALRNAIDDVKAVCAGVADMVDRGIAEIDSLRLRFAGSIVVPMLPTSEADELMAKEVMAAARQEAAASRILTPTEQRLQTAALDAMAERDQMSEMLSESQLDRISLANQTDELRAEVARLRKIFDDAGKGEHNVLALVEHYQDEATQAQDDRAMLKAARRALAHVAEHMTEHAYQELVSALEADEEIAVAPPTNPHPSGCHTEAPGSRDCDSDGHESCRTCSRRKERDEQVFRQGGIVVKPAWPADPWPSDDETRAHERAGRSYEP